MGTLNVREEQKCGECVKASQSRGKQGCKSREGVTPDWEKQKSPQPGCGGQQDDTWGLGEGRRDGNRSWERRGKRGREREGTGREERDREGEEGGRERNISMGRGLLEEPRWT